MCCSRRLDSTWPLPVVPQRPRAYHAPLNQYVMLLHSGTRGSLSREKALHLTVLRAVWDFLTSPPLSASLMGPLSFCGCKHQALWPICSTCREGEELSRTSSQRYRQEGGGRCLLCESGELGAALKKETSHEERDDAIDSNEWNKMIQRSLLMLQDKLISWNWLNRVLR